MVWSITALHLTILLAYSILAPTYRAPDEPLHVDLAHLFSEELRYPAWDERDTGSGILRSLDLVEFHSGSRNLEAAEAPNRGDRPSIDELEEPPRSRGANQLPQHPPLYYAIAGGLERGVDAVTGDPIRAFDLEAWFYRLVSMLIIAPVPVLIYRTGRRLALPEPVSTAATLFPLAVPNYLHIGSVANNDSLLILLFCALTPLVVRLADGDVGLRAAALAGFVTGLAMYTKGFALVMPFWVLAGLVVALRRLGTDHIGRVARAGVVYSAASLAAGGWWWIANVIRYGQLAPSRYGELVQPIEDDARDLVMFLRTWGELTTRRFWGDFGWFDVHIPGVAVIAASAVVVTALVVACARRDRVAATPVGNRLLLAAPFVLLVALQFRNALQAYLDLGRMPGLQGRYWFGAMAALAVIVALGIANLRPSLVRLLPIGMLAGAVAMNVLGVRAMLGHYWGAPGSTVTERIRAAVAWAPMEGEMIAIGAIVGLVVGLATVAQLVVAAIPPAVPTGDDQTPSEAAPAPDEPVHASPQTV